MGAVVVLGEGTSVLGYGLAGAVAVPADSARAVLEAWDSLGPQVEVVVLTPAAARALTPARTASTSRPLTVVMPE